MSVILKIGIVGFGRIVELVHLNLIKNLNEFEVSGVFDSTTQRRELAAKRGFKVYAELEDLLQSDVDVILIATPPNSHFPIASECLKQGKHVLIEKPVTLSSAEADALLELSRLTGKHVTVFHNRRFDSDYQLVKQMLQEETLGSLLFVERRHHMFGSGASFGVKSFNPGWRNELSYGGGALLDWGVHLIDQLLLLGLGSFTSVHAKMHALRWNQGNVDDYVHAVFQTEDDILVTMEVNFGSNIASPLWVVGGDRATLCIASEKEAFILEKGKAPQPIQMQPVNKLAAHKIYTSFAGCVLRGEKLAVSLEEAARTMRVVDVINESARMGKELNYGNSIFFPASRV